MTAGVFWFLAHSKNAAKPTANFWRPTILCGRRTKTTWKRDRRQRPASQPASRSPPPNRSEPPFDRSPREAANRPVAPNMMRRSRPPRCKRGKEGKARVRTGTRAAPLRLSAWLPPGLAATSAARVARSTWSADRPIAKTTRCISVARKRLGAPPDHRRPSPMTATFGRPTADSPSVVKIHDRP